MSSLDTIRGRQTVAVLTNQSGGGVVEGDVVILDPANADSFTTTAVEGQTDELVGVALETIAAAADGRVCVFGYVAQVNLDGAAALGDYIKTDGVVKQGTPVAVRGAGIFGQVHEANATPPATIWGMPDQAVVVPDTSIMGLEFYSHHAGILLHANPGVGYVNFNPAANQYLEVIIEFDTVAWTHARLVVEAGGNEAGAGKGLKFVIGGANVEKTWNGVGVATRDSGWIAIVSPGGVPSFTLQVIASSVTEDIEIYRGVVFLKKV